MVCMFMSNKKGIPFRIISGSKTKINTGCRIEVDGVESVVTSIKSVRFENGRVEIIGLAKQGNN